ncbi:MAG: GNAT family N-acetyltransferase [Saprospiraceae bacterium]|nr:GNAT family N-acetyltransferase [Saprospiraceae bacterium]
MTLVAANHGLVSADLSGRSALAEKLEAVVPESWPPDLYDRTAMGFALEELEDSRMQGWSFWYLVLTDSNELAGICGFKGRPDQAGSVEIGYSILSQYRGMGLATEAAMRLIAWAFTHRDVLEVSAETFPHLKSSIRVLEKNGMELRGRGSEPGVVRYAVARPDRS